MTMETKKFSLQPSSLFHFPHYVEGTHTTNMPLALLLPDASSRSLRQLLLVSFALIYAPQSKALKHTFHRQNGPSLVGPVGLPFAFLDTGHYELSVLNYELNVASAPPSTKFEAGFLLQKFRNEMDFQKYLQVLQDNRTACAFEYFRTDLDNVDDVLGGVDDQYAHVGEITSAEHGIYLPVHGPYVSKKTKTKSVQYQFRKGEAGLYFLLYQGTWDRCW